MSAIQLFEHDYIHSVLVSTDFSQISFQCSRIQPPGRDAKTIYIHPDIYTVFLNALKGKASEDMRPNNSGECIVGNMSHCGNRRGDLAECRCEDLNRKTKPYIRHQFENTVIGKILTHPKIEQSLSSRTPFQFNMAIFCSGRLLGEEILLFRLFNALHNKGVSGTINLCLIDRREYTAPIKLGNPADAMKKYSYLRQFLTEICESLPPSIKINGTFFAEADDYTAYASADDRNKHDLLIGADMEGAHTHMPQMNATAGVDPHQPPLALVRPAQNTGLPSVCEVSLSGELTNCYAPLNMLGSGLSTNGTPQRSSSELTNCYAPLNMLGSGLSTNGTPQRSSSEFPIVLVVVGVAVLAILVFAIIKSDKK